MIAGDKHGRPGSQPRDQGRRRVYPRQNAVDAATVRMIQRMLPVGWLGNTLIAREAGVSPNFVTQVAQGKRLAVATTRPALDDGERFLKVPVRCRGCRGLICIVPCRACKGRRQRESRCSAPRHVR